MKSKFNKALTYIFLTVVSIMCLFPFVWMLISATNLSKDITLGKFTIGAELINNFRKLSEMVDLKQILFNSSKIAIIVTIVSVLICSMAGYGFEMYKSKYKNYLFVLLLLSMMLPFSAMMIPLFKMFSNMGLLNTHIAVIIPSVATAFLIFFFRQSNQSFPSELMEAARIDGLNEIQTFFRVYIPTMKSTFSAAAIITFMASWNGFLWPLIVLQSPEKKTLPLVISSLSSAYQPDYGVIMAAIIISVIPTALIFFLLQKNFVEGMVGSVK